MLNTLKQIATPARIAALGLILYLSRALAELGALMSWPIGTLIGALIGLISGIALVRSRYFQRIALLPLLILWIYVLYPAFAPFLALNIAAAALLTTLIPSFRLKISVIWLDVLIAAASLALYWLTLSPGLLPADAGEFQWVAAKLGIAHPPGYALYTILAWLFTLMFPADPARSVNLFSAVIAALTVMLAGRAARQLSGSVWGGIAAALCLAVAASFWSTATQASIRPLTAFFTALSVERLAHFTRANPRVLATFALAFGLGIAHHLSIAFLAPIFVLYIVLIDPAILRQPRRWLLPLIAFAGGFLPWLYLPIRGAMQAPLAPDNLATWDGFWNHVLARGFANEFFYYHTPTQLADRARIWPNIIALQWGLPVILLSIPALLALARYQWRAAVMLLSGTLIHSFITMTYPALQTIEYLIPAYVLLAIAAGSGLGLAVQSPSGEFEAALQPLAWHFSARQLFPALFAALLIAAALHGAAQYPSYAHLARDDSTRQRAESLLINAPPDALILTGWHWYAAMQALQAIEGTRPDVEVVYVYPEGAETYAQTWVRRIGAGIDADRAVYVTSFFPAEFAASPYFFEPVLGGWQARGEPRTDLPPDFDPVEIPFSSGVTLIGIAPPASGSARIGDVFSVRLAWRIDQPVDQDVTAFVHFVNAANTLISSSDRRLPTSRADVGSILIDQYIVGMPPSGTTSDAYSLLAGMYIVSPDGTLTGYSAGDADRVPIADVEMLPAAWPAPTANPRYGYVAPDATLRGYDWELGKASVHATVRNRYASEYLMFSTWCPVQPHLCSLDIGMGNLPIGVWGFPSFDVLDVPPPQSGDRYVPFGGEMVLTHISVSPQRPLTPGDEVIVDLTLLSTKPLIENHFIKIDLIGEGHAWRVGSDELPAMSAIPTIKWLWGWEVHDRHRLIVPPDATITAAQVVLIVYNATTGELLPILDPTLAQQGISVPLYTWP